MRERGGGVLVDGCFFLVDARPPRDSRVTQLGAQNSPRSAWFAGFLRKAAAAAERAGAITIVDEVQSGFGRSGGLSMWAFERENASGNPEPANPGADFGDRKSGAGNPEAVFAPQILTFGKPAGNCFPLAGVYNPPPPPTTPHSPINPPHTTPQSYKPPIKHPPVICWCVCVCAIRCRWSIVRFGFGFGLT